MLKRNERPKYIWVFSFEKMTEGGSGAPDASITKMINAIEGVRGFKGPSPYVGHTSYTIQARNLESMRKAFSILKEYSYINNNVEEEIESAKFQTEAWERGYF
jgi:hypothetical protein